MPTHDQFRAARTLLGLTQHQVHAMMGISTQALKDIESPWDFHIPQRPYAQYYNLWLREYARMVKPDLLSAVDGILGNENFARMFRIVEPVKKMMHCTVINENGMQFTSTAQCARWLIEQGHTSARLANVAQRIRNAINGTGPKTYLGFTFRYDDKPKDETMLDI